MHPRWNTSVRPWHGALILALTVVSAQAAPQDPAQILQSLQGAQTGPAAQVVPQGLGDALPRGTLRKPSVDRTEVKERRLDEELKALRAKDKGPRRFAADLFDTRELAPLGTEGGISEDYVLGTGDELQVNVFGSATFEVPAQVDGRGELVIPKVGTVKVGGMTLGRARAAVQAKVGQNFSRASVDLAVTRLREVRVFVLGEVYRPGSYLVPSLSSLVNVLGLAGGPTRAGSFREIRVVRGGRVVHTVDLYPLRAEGLGNMNVGLQNGDTVFVPLAFNVVTLEGAFTRVVAAADLEAAQAETPVDETEDLPESQRSLLRQIRSVEIQLGKHGEPQAAEEAGIGEELPPGPPTLSPKERIALEDRLEVLRDELKSLQRAARGDHRVDPGVRLRSEFSGQAGWLARWQEAGEVPLMQFELRPGETVAEALRFAGGFAVEGFAERLSLQRLDGGGRKVALDVSLASAGTLVLQRGDVLSALPRRDEADRAIEVGGWVRVPGVFARVEGLTLGALLKRDGQVLPDTYLARGEVVRTHEDGRTRLQVFDVAKALAGDPAHDLRLQDRDRITLHRIEDLRVRKTVTVTGPVSRPGTFPYHEDMRAADLLFMAGAPLLKADRFVAELAHTREGKPSEVRSLDLTRLLSTEQGSPVDLKDEALNPRIEPFDQLSIFAKPDYRPHRTVTVSGQVARPGAYSLDQDRASLKDVLVRAGGLTPEAMPEGAIFLRKLGSLDPEKVRAAQLAGIEATDPTSGGINDILKRLSETKRQGATGKLLESPMLHGLEMGDINRMVIRLTDLLKGDAAADVELQDGDELIVPRRTDAAYVVGEAASPFAAYKVQPGTTVRELLRWAGGPTRNADTWNIRLLKADGRILDSWIMGKKVEPGDAVLVPQRFRRDTSWQENLNALTPLALILNALK